MKDTTRCSTIDIAGPMWFLSRDEVDSMVRYRPVCFGFVAHWDCPVTGTTWGLFRHSWVSAKLFLTVSATVVLLLKMKLIGYIAGVATTTVLSSGDLSMPRTELAVHAAGGLLLVITTLSVFKPSGLTRYGQHKLQQRCEVQQQLDKVSPARSGFNTFLAVIAVLVAAFVVLHLAGHGLHHSH